MQADEYKEKIIKIIDDYLSGNITGTQASSFALGIIKTGDWEKLPVMLSNAIHILFDLHDRNKSWMPTKEELKRCKEALENTI